MNRSAVGRVRAAETGGARPFSTREAAKPIVPAAAFAVATFACSARIVLSSVASGVSDTKATVTAEAPAATPGAAAATTLTSCASTRASITVPA